MDLVLLVSRVWEIFFRYRTDSCFPLAGGLCKLYANAREKLQIERQPL